MEVDRPEPGQELNTGEPTVPRVAASVIVLRDSPSGPEVLLVQRNPEAKFMGGAWVFPGGAVARGSDEEPAHTALRELEEEAAIAIEDPDALAVYSRWITPAQVKIRFDTWFFVAKAPDGAEGKCDGEECVGLQWIRPADALDAHQRDELSLVFPTIKHLEELVPLESVEHALETARARRVMPVEPRVVMAGGVASILLPGEPGYDEG